MHIYIGRGAEIHSGILICVTDTNSCYVPSPPENLVQQHAVIWRANEYSHMFMTNGIATEQGTCQAVDVFQGLTICGV